MSIARHRTKGQLTDMSGRVIGVAKTATIPWWPYNYGYPEEQHYPWGQQRGEVTDCWDETHQGPPYRSGGPLFLIRRSANYEDGNASCENWFWKYDGMLSIDGGMSELNTWAATLAPSARGFGAEAYKKFRPIQPKVDFGQWLAELRELPQNPWPWKVADIKHYVREMKNVGGQYLNYEFGWKPFVKDLVKMWELSNKAENYIKFAKKNNNKWLKRGGTIKNEHNVTRETVPAKASPTLSSYLYSAYSWPCQKTVIDRDTVWFKARMKYYIEDLKTDPCDSVWSSRLLRHMYGLTLTPSLAWELIPFTWLQDWVVNIGDVISNFSLSLYDNLVTKYAYVMRHRSRMIIYDEDVPMVTGTVKVRAVLNGECKERDGTSQYCMGSDGLFSTTFTARQQRILLALGVSLLGK